jgi:outer membrane protein
MISWHRPTTVFGQPTSTGLRLALCLICVIGNHAAGTAARGQATPSIGAAVNTRDAAQPVPEATVALSLDEAVQLALERNLDISIQRLNPELQEIQIRSAEAAYATELTATASTASQTTAPTSQLQVSSGGGGVRSDTYAYNAALSKLFKTGGTLSATLNNSRQESTSNNVFHNPQYTSTWTVSASQPLLRGFTIDPQRRALTIARINRDVSEIQVRATVTNVVSDVRNAYWDLVFATQSVDVARESLSLATALVRDNTVRVEIGTMAPIDVLQARAEQASRQQALVAAESTRRTAELSLKRLLVASRADAYWSATIVPTDRPDFVPAQVDVAQAIEQALERRTDLEVARQHVRANATTLKWLRNAVLPEVNVTLMYGTQGVGGPYLIRSDSSVLGSTVTETVPGDVTDAFGSLFAFDNPRWSVGINLSVPIGTTEQDAALARARVELRQVDSQVAQVELQIVTEVTNATVQLRNAAEGVQAAQASRTLMQLRLEGEEAKFSVGMSTNYFVVQAQRDLSDARNSELRAILSYRKALVEFERLQQTTLDSSNISLLQ